MASSLTDLSEVISKLQNFLQDPKGLSTWREAVRSTALETRRIIDELFESPDLTWKKEKALMFALERIAGGPNLVNLGLSVGGYKRIARIFEAAERIHRATDQEELNQGLDDLNAA